jgi:hypothetical protein
MQGKNKGKILDQNPEDLPAHTQRASGLELVHKLAKLEQKTLIFEHRNVR